MSKLDDIFKFLDLQNSIVTLISGIEYLIYDAYGYDEVQTSPETIEKTNACFASLEHYFSQKEIVFLPDTIGNMISSYLLEECKDKTLFGQLLETKFSKHYFDVKHDYGCFYDYCRAADRPDIAEHSFL
jgi:hypothetical protein